MNDRLNTILVCILGGIVGSLALALRGQEVPTVITGTIAAASGALIAILPSGRGPSR